MQSNKLGWILLAPTLVILFFSVFCRFSMSFLSRSINGTRLRHHLK